MAQPFPQVLGSLGYSPDVTGKLPVKKRVTCRGENFLGLKDVSSARVCHSIHLNSYILS